MTTTSAPAVVTLKGLIDGFQLSQAIHVAAALGLADLLAYAPRYTESLREKGTTPP